jgi:hypothetical protein
LKKVIIYDDFYGAPDTLVDTIKSMEFESPNQGNYPGKNSKFVHYPEDFNDFFSYLTGENVKAATKSSSDMFRLTTQSDTYKQRIHVDLPNMNCSWAGVLYLNKEFNQESGTKFWQHKELKMDELPLNISEASKYGFHSLDDVKNFMETDGLDETKWINVMSVPMKYNRLVLFRPWMWHSIGAQFGTDDSTARLTQLFFLEPRNANNTN